MTYREPAPRVVDPPEPAPPKASDPPPPPTLEWARQRERRAWVMALMATAVALAEAIHERRFFVIWFVVLAGVFENLLHARRSLRLERARWSCVPVYDQKAGRWVRRWVT